jgi:hypothetical protein
MRPDARRADLCPRRQTKKKRNEKITKNQLRVNFFPQLRAVTKCASRGGNYSEKGQLTLPGVRSEFRRGSGAIWPWVSLCDWEVNSGHNELFAVTGLPPRDEFADTDSENILFHSGGIEGNFRIVRDGTRARSK